MDDIERKIKEYGFSEDLSNDEENKELWDKFIDYFDLKNINL